MIITTVSGNKVSIDASRVVNVQESWHDGRRCVYIAMDNKQGFNVFDSVESLDAKIRDETGMIKDDPTNDGTPYQHPAFGRGERYALKMIVREINAILDGKVITGVVSDPEFQALRERLEKVSGPANEEKPVSMVSLNVEEIKALKHMIMMNTPIGGPRT